MSQSGQTYQTDARLQAHQWLKEVIINGRSTNELLAIPSNLSLENVGFAKNLLFGCLRYYFQLETLVNNLLEKPLKAKDKDLHLLLIIGLYQLKYLSTPDHAAISETVNLTKKIKKNWATAMVNGVLRSFQREESSLAEQLKRSLQYQYAHPGWIVKQLKNDWPHNWESILTSNNQKAPMTIRVNTRKVSRNDYLSLLKEVKLEAVPHRAAKDALILATACDVFQLPGFEEGLVTVQDAAAQLVVEALDLSLSHRVLDACAAPGGKTTHILQRLSGGSVVAVEMSESRAKKIEQTLKRMNMVCDLQIADASQVDTWWDGKLFDRILLDVPCSASGVIRRNPDIKIHRKVTDLIELEKVQYQILEAAWQLLKPGGTLVYATCSVFKRENEMQIGQFLGQYQAKEIKADLNLPDSLVNRAEYGIQIFPGELEMDGFYFCALKKTSAL